MLQMANPNITNEHFSQFCVSLASVSVSQIHSVSFAIAVVIFSVLTIASNIILVYTLYKTKQLNTISNKLILVMNISDLCLGLITFPVLVIINLKRYTFNVCNLEKGSSFVSLFFGTFSFAIIYCISIDRYFRVMRLNRYNLYMNTFRMKMMVIASFSFACGVALVMNLHPSFLQQVFVSIGNMFAIIFLIIIYRPVLRRLQDHVSMLNSQRINSNVPSGNNETSINFQKRRNQLLATRTVKFLLITIVVLYAPFHVMLTWWTYYKFEKKTAPDHRLSVMYSWSCLLAMSNAYINSWIIIYGNTRSRRFVSTLLQRCRTTNRVADEI